MTHKHPHHSQQHAHHDERRKHHVVEARNKSFAITLPADALNTVNAILKGQCSCRIDHSEGTKPLVVLDPGHGKFRYDPVTHPQKNAGKMLHDAQGYIYDDYGGVVKPPHVKHHAEAPPIHEAPINLQIAKKLQAKLQAMGFEVMLTRNSADDIIASKYDARMETGTPRKVMHLAIHADIAPNTAPKGMVMYCSRYTPHGSPSAIFAAALGGAKADDHYTDLLIPLRPEQKQFPMAMVEVGNMRNKAELAYIMSDAGQEAITTTLAQRMLSYYNVMHPDKTLLPAFPAFPFQTAIEPFSPFNEPFSPFIVPPIKAPAPRGK